MPNLCETCPLRGDIECEAVGLVGIRDTAAMITKSYGFPVGTLGVLFDGEGNASEVLNLSQAHPREASANAILGRVKECDDPIERTRFIDRLLRRKPLCPALGHLAIDRSYPIDASVAFTLEPDLKRDARIAGILYKLKQQSQARQATE